MSYQFLESPRDLWSEDEHSRLTRMFVHLLIENRDMQKEIDNLKAELKIAKNSEAGV